ncbi:hypothetical protein PCANC_13247 [Puccinia coronata f. sp. avenae]|uniref:Uncharacterized protein n=1 Tax=Puccinia coronata f. sp. avenae TaxID=200324 RepID=A0A2N5V0Q7_9BASI|nr:hypothetical protein PCANC_13247 [Puccinia coronata f. sp. avenae]
MMTMIGPPQSILNRRSRSIDPCMPLDRRDDHIHAPAENRETILHAVLRQHITHLLALPAEEEEEEEEDNDDDDNPDKEEEQHQPVKPLSLTRTLSLSSLQHRYPHSECCSPTSIYSHNTSVDSPPSIPLALIPAIILSSDSDPHHLSQPQPHPQPGCTPSSHPSQEDSCLPALLSYSLTPKQNTAMSSSLLPQKLRSRFMPSKSAVPLNTKSHGTPSSTRPAPVQVPPSNVGLVIDPDSWVHSDDSDEEGPADAKGNKPAGMVVVAEDDDEVPLSQLRKTRLCSMGELASSRKPVSPPAPEPGVVGDADPTRFSKVLKRYCSSRSLRSLCKKGGAQLPATAPPSLPDRPRVHYQPAAAAAAAKQRSSQAPGNGPQGRTLRSATSFPDLSQRLSSPNHPPPTPLTARPGNAFLPCPPSLSSPSIVNMAALSPQLSPSNQYLLFPRSAKPGALEFPTPPSSISPTTRSLKLSSPQSSVVSARSSERDVYRRMRRRHISEIHSLHHHHHHRPQPSNASSIGQVSSPLSPPIDGSLYSKLNDAQRRALLQRSDLLYHNLTSHLEAFAHEMIRSSQHISHHHPHLPHPHLFQYDVVGAY